MICPNCGASLSDSAKFCNTCGQSMTAEAAPVYTQPIDPGVPPTPYANPYTYQQPQDTRPLSLGQFVGMEFLMWIPIANIVLLFIWAFGAGYNVNKANWAKSKLIVVGVGLAVFVLFFSLIFSLVYQLILSSYNGGFGNFYQYFN